MDIPRVVSSEKETEGEINQSNNEWYLLACMVDTLATSHLLTSLLNSWALSNTARREKARVRMGKNVADGNDETAGEELNTYCFAY